VAVVGGAVVEPWWLPRVSSGEDACSYDEGEDCSGCGSLVLSFGCGGGWRSYGGTMVAT